MKILLIFLTLAESINKSIIRPFLKSAYDIITILGGLSIWILIIISIVKVIESKLGPTGWYRSTALTTLFETFKRFLISIVILYVVVYVIAFVMNIIGTSISPVQLATKIILDMLFKPFTTLYKYIVK